MREIKFRCWVPNCNRILEWYEVKRMFTNNGSIFGLSDGILIYHKNIMQYTGLKDVKGKEIYEGDIVKVNNIDPHDYFFAQIKFEGGSFIICNNDYFPDSYITFIDFGIDEDRLDVEVIGNIHKNPELLGEL